MLILALSIAIAGLAFAVDKVFDFFVDRRQRKGLRDRVRSIRW